MSSDHDSPQAVWRRRSELSDLLLSVRSRLIRPDADGHERSLRQQDVADLVGISVRYYAAFERGEIDNPSVTLVEAIASALRMSEAQRSALHVLALSHDPPMPARQPGFPGSPPVVPQALRGFAIMLCIVPSVNLALTGFEGPELRAASGADWAGRVEDHRVTTQTAPMKGASANQ